MKIPASRLIVTLAAISIVGSPIANICSPACAKDPSADSLYDLAKTNFDNGQLTDAESLMRQSLQLEKTMKRPAALVRTEIALATILVAAHRTGEAKQIYEEALAIANEHKLKQEAISISINLGAIAMQEGTYEQARKLYKQALADSQAQGLPAAQANVLINLAVLERAQNHLQEAMSCLKQALPLLSNDGSETQVGNLLMEIARVQADMGKHEEAIATYHKAKEHFAQDFDAVSGGKALMAAGQVFLTQEKYADATKELSEAIKTLSPEDGSVAISASGPTLTDCLVSLAAVYTAEKQFDQSEKTLKQALSIAESIKSADRKRSALSELGYLMLVRGLTEQALEKYLQAYELLPKANEKPSKMRAVLLIDLAMCYKALGQLDQAIKSYEQALTILASIGDVQAQGLAANNLAVAYLDGGKTKDFDRLWQQASTLFAQAHDKKGQAIMSYNLGQSKLVGKKFAEAIPDYQQALSLMRASGDANGIGQAFLSQTLCGLGLAYLLNASQPQTMPAQLNQAIQCYEEALKLSEQNQTGEANTEAKWDCHLGLGKAYKKLGDKDQALSHLREAVNIAEHERSQLSRDTFKTFNLDMRQDCFYELVDLLIQQNQAEEALEIAERSRARAFADLLAAREQSVTHKLDNTGSSTLNSAPLPALSTFKQAQDFSVTSPVASQALTTAELKQLAHDHGATILEYYALPEKLLVWLIDPNGTVRLLPAQNISLPKLAGKTAELYNAVIAQPKTLEEIKQSGSVRQAKLKEMYKLLIGPAESFLQSGLQSGLQSSKKVVVVPHGPLFLVPFAALMNGQGKFLVESFTLSFTPAISVLQSTAKLEASALQGNSLLAFGNPKTEIFAELGSLPYAEKEVEKAAELFGKLNTTVELGTQASKACFVQYAPKTSVIHMACHGIINEEHPTMSGLVLAKDGKDNGFLPVKDILNLPPLKSRLVVLSACQTGRGKITGDGVIGLSRAFIAAGTPSVIVSQWNVDDVIAEYQMEAFYKTLLSGKNKAESLREAQIKTIASMEGTQVDTSSPTFIRANPRYWAAFQLIGEAQ